jgi:ankyrin repeat protein
MARVAELLGAGTPVDALESPESLTALEAAAAQGHLAVVELLLDRGAALRQSQVRGIFAAQLAAHQGHLAVLEAVVRRAALAPDPSPLLCGAMTDAAAQGHVPVLEHLLALGVAPDATCTAETPLERASAYGRTEAALLLLGRGATLRLSKSGAVVAACRAAGPGELALVQALVAAAAPLGGSVDDRFGEALARAAGSGNAPVVRYLLDLGVDVDWTPGRGKELPPAGRAAWGNGDAVVPMLLAAGADPDASFLLDWAVMTRDPARVDAVLARGADPRGAGYCGNPVAYFAYLARSEGRPTSGQLAAVERLLERGMDPNVPCHGKRPLTWARENGQTELAERLVAAGGREGTTLGRKLLWLPEKVAMAGYLALMLLLGSH